MEIKKIIALLLIANIGLLQAQYTAIPSSCFEHYLVYWGYDTEGIEDGQILTADIENINGIDLSGVSDINCTIFDSTGIEDFTNLEYLSGDNTGFTSIDLSNNIHLKEIEFNSGSLQNINITNCTELTSLIIGYTQLSNIDLSTNLNLEILFLSNNLLTSIDTSNNINLLRFFAYNNQLTEFNVNHLINLNDFGCSNNLITTLDVSNLSALTIFSANENLITNINLSNLPNLEGFTIAVNNLIQINISNFNNLSNINFRNNQLESVDIRNGNNHNFTYFNTENNPNLTCVFVDNATYSANNWLLVDSTTTFVETEAQCIALATEEEIINNSFNVYPNPIKDILTIKNNNFEINTIFVYDILGKQIIKSNTNKIDFTNVKDGVYFLKIYTKKGIELNKKIIKSVHNKM